MKENFQKWTAEVGNEKRYDRQSDVIKQALESPDRGLDTLLCLMRASGESAVYLNGTRVDNEFGLGSDYLGVAISAQPRDGVKFAEPG
jgi:hypothetical protein